MNRQKRAQITIFFMIGIVLMILFSAALYYRNYITISRLNPETQQKSAQGQQQITNFIESTVETELEEGFKKLPGLAEIIAYDFRKTDPNSIIEHLDVPIFFDSGYNKVPSEAKISEIINRYAIQQIQDINLDVEELENCRIDKNLMSTKTTIQQSQVSITVRGIRAACNSMMITVQPITITMDSRLKDMIDATDKIITRQLGSGDSLEITYVTDVCEDMDLECVMIVLDDNTIAYSLADPKAETPTMTFAGIL